MFVTFCACWVNTGICSPSWLWQWPLSYAYGDRKQMQYRGTSSQVEKREKNHHIELKLIWSRFDRIDILMKPTIKSTDLIRFRKRVFQIVEIRLMTVKINVIASLWRCFQMSQKIGCCAGGRWVAEIRTRREIYWVLQMHEIHETMAWLLSANWVFKKQAVPIYLRQGLPWLLVHIAHHFAGHSVSIVDDL